VLSPIWDPLDELIFVLISASGMNWLRRLFPRHYDVADGGDEAVV
jgi:hypothetical protein